MGGQVLEYEAKTIWRAGKKEGIAEGHAAGFNDGRISVYLNMRRKGISLQDAQLMTELDDALVKEAENTLAKTSKNE